MTLFIQVALAAALVTLVVLPVRRRTQGALHPALLVGMCCWMVGLAAVTGSALLDSMLAEAPRWPNVGHVLWVASLPLVYYGTFARQGAHRDYIGWRLVFDVLMICAAWLLPIWKICLYRPGANGLGDIDWVALLVMASEVSLFTTVALLAANIFSRTMLLMATCNLLLVAADCLALWSRGRSVDLHLWQTLAIVTAVLALVVALATISSPRELSNSEMAFQSRVRSALTTALVAAPMVVYIPQMAGGDADAGSLVLSSFLIAAFAAREWHRAHQNKQLLSQLGELAHLDSLTGLANRHALDDELRHWSGADTTISVLTLDVDRFKEVNRQLSHGAGDRVLIEIAELLRQQSECLAFRLGGDEFALLTTSVDTDAVRLAERLRAEATERLTGIPGVEQLAITLSIGVAKATGTDRVTDPLGVLSRSALALRSAKAERNQVAMFTDADARSMEAAELLEERLRLAVHEGRITFIYQPIVDLHDGRIVSFEALARWRDSQLGQVRPDEFIPLAERNGLIHEIGWQCLRESLQLQSLLRSQGTVVGISVNVSPVQLRRATFADDLLDLLAAHQLPTDAVTLEVTEGVFIDLDDPAVAVLRRVHRSGVGIAIDDFGSGYSSLGYLTRLPTDTLKVDKALTGNLNRPQPRSILHALLTVSAAHEVHVVIEGVDSPELAAELRTLGAQYAQGWLYSRGVAAAEVPSLCRRNASVGSAQVSSGRGEPGPRQRH